MRSEKMSHPPFKVRELGEIAIRCSDINRMVEFYRDIVGLEVMLDTRDEGIVFFRICDGFGGHTTVLALFLPNAGRAHLHPQGYESPETGVKSSLHHLALTVAFEEQNSIEQWLRDNQIEYRIQVFGWIGWKGIFIEDPEGNTVEFVAAEKSLLSNSK